MKDRAATVEVISTSETKLKKGTLSAFSGMCLVVGLMIGSGIFSNPGKVYVFCESVGMSILLWIIGGMVTLFGTFAYIELGTMLPSNGGEQTYLDVAFSKPRALISFLFCWAMILLIRPGSAAADSVVFAEYIIYPAVGDSSSPLLQRIIALACISSITLMNMASTRVAVVVHDCLTIIKVIVLGIIAVSGVLVTVGAIHIPNRPDNFSNPFATVSTNGGAYAAAFFKIFWAYDGWNNLNYAVAELDNPSKNLPRAAGMGVLLVTILYVTANISYFAVVPLNTIVESSGLLAGEFFHIMFGDVAGSKVLPVFVALSSYGSVCAMVFSAGRIIFAAAEAGILPGSRWVKVLNSRFETPVRALAVNWVITVILIVAPPPGAAFDLLVDLVGYPEWLFYGLSIIGLISMRKTHTHLTRPFKVFLPLCIAFICVSIFLCIFPFVPSDSPEFPYFLPPVIAISTLILGVPVWWIFVKNNQTLNMDFS